MNTLLSIRDCARQLGVAAHRIAYAHDTGKLRDVRRRVAGKRIYTPKDVQRVADYFGVDSSPTKTVIVGRRWVNWTSNLSPTHTDEPEPPAARFSMQPKPL